MNSAQGRRVRKKIWVTTSKPAKVSTRHVGQGICSREDNHGPNSHGNHGAMGAWARIPGLGRRVENRPRVIRWLGFWNCYKHNLSAHNGSARFLFIRCKLFLPFLCLRLNTHKKSKWLWGKTGFLDAPGHKKPPFNWTYREQLFRCFQFIEQQQHCSTNYGQKFTEIMSFSIFFKQTSNEFHYR